MADMNEEMESLMAAMAKNEDIESDDEVTKLLGGEKHDNKQVRGRAEKARAEKGDESGVSKVLKKVLPIVGAGLGSLILGLVLGAVMFGGGETEQAVVHEIDAVNLKAPILEKLDSVKDAQIRSLEKELAELNVLASLNGEEAQTVMAMPFKNAGKAANSINGLLDTVIALSPTATDAEVRVAVDQVAQYMTQSGVATTPYKLMTGASPAKELNTNCKKASRATLSVAGISADAELVVLIVYVPVMAADSTLHEAVYVALVNNGYVESCEYVGMWTPGAGSDVDAALASAFETIAAVKNNQGGVITMKDLESTPDAKPEQLVDATAELDTQSSSDTASSIPAERLEEEQPSSDIAEAEAEADVEAEANPAQEGE